MIHSNKFLVKLLIKLVKLRLWNAYKYIVNTNYVELVNTFCVF